MYDRIDEIKERVKKNPKLVEEHERILKEPEILLQTDSKSQKAFLKGFFDFHGSIYMDENDHFILSIRSKNTKKIEVAKQILANCNIHSLVFHQQHPKKLGEPSRLLIVGFPDIVEFDKVIGIENPELDQRYQTAFENFIKKENFLERIKK